MANPDFHSYLASLASRGCFREYDSVGFLEPDGTFVVSTMFQGPPEWREAPRGLEWLGTQRKGTRRIVNFTPREGPEGAAELHNALQRLLDALNSAAVGA